MSVDEWLLGVKGRGGKEVEVVIKEQPVGPCDGNVVSLDCGGGFRKCDEVA